MRNVFTVGVKRNVVPALFPEIELQSQKLYDQDVGEASGLDVLYDVTHLFYSSWLFSRPPGPVDFLLYSTIVLMSPFRSTDDETFQ